ncbi:MAG: ABC transporter permease [Bacilli bacterium]|jgi:ABC-2 type transport system permease protein|nr:ABC transporter permease [Bacilli bacterium]
MFSKALFKQSVKANGWMWVIITAAECFMLSCVMVISGNGNVGQVKNSVEDTIIKGEIDSALKSRALYYYDLSDGGLENFDNYYVADFQADYQDVSSYIPTFDAWALTKPVKTSSETDEEYQARLTAWQAKMPKGQTISEQYYQLLFQNWSSAMPSQTSYASSDDYLKAMQTWQANKPDALKTSSQAAFYQATNELKDAVLKEAEANGYKDNSQESNEMLGAVMYALKPTSDFNSIFTANSEEVPADYDVSSLIQHINSGDIQTYLSSDERNSYRQDRSRISSSVFLGDNMSKQSTVDTLLETLSKYGVDETKYATFGYTYTNIKGMSSSAIVSFQARFDYELEAIDKKNSEGGYASNDDYLKAKADLKVSLKKELSLSLLASLPTDVSKAIEDVGQMDLYGLIVGSVFYKIAGLLLPIIYAIMASNNLVSTQVDTGSMAYVLSTGTKRKTVTFTQICFLILSLLGMFICTLITSCICWSSVSVSDSGLNYAKLCLINLGAFLVLFAISGLNFFTSCHFDRTKNSMALGGGLSIFFLVATILGLFGSPVIPSVVRFPALNNFNYVSLITLFDVISITDQTTDFIWKFAILFAIGLCGYIAGSIRFDKKDLPL